MQVGRQVTKGDTPHISGMCSEQVPCGSTHLSLQLSQNTPSAKASGREAVFRAAASANVRPVASLNEVFAPVRAVQQGRPDCQCRILLLPSQGQTPSNTPVAMHSRLLELMGSITITSVRPPPSLFLKQCDRPCVQRAAAGVGCCCCCLSQADGAQPRNSEAWGPVDTTHHHTVGIGLQILACPHKQHRSSPILLWHAGESSSPADRRRNGMTSGTPSCWAAGSAILQLHREGME